jgi:uncharacterized DUF497 family protein
MVFEWDENKRQSNILKHQLDFPYAAFVFADSERIDFIDDRKIYGEERRITIGRVEEFIFVVVYTQRREAIRIISFRFANKKEKIYYENKNENRRNP